MGGRLAHRVALGDRNVLVEGLEEGLDNGGVELGARRGAQLAPATLSETA